MLVFVDRSRNRDDDDIRLPKISRFARRMKTSPMAALKKPKKLCCTRPNADISAGCSGHSSVWRRVPDTASRAAIPFPAWQAKRQAMALP